MRQEVIRDVVAQLQQVGLIDPNILATLSVPYPRGATFAQTAEQGDDINEGDESSTEDLV